MTFLLRETMIQTTSAREVFVYWKWTEKIQISVLNNVQK